MSRGRRRTGLGAGVMAGLCGSLLLSAAAANPPPGAPGDCFVEQAAPRARTVAVERPEAPEVTWRRVAAVYRIVSRNRLVAPAHDAVEILPAEYATAPRYRVEPGAERWVRAPAVYRRVVSRSLVSPAHLAWRRQSGRADFVNGASAGEVAVPTGEVLCRILVPARYAEVSRRVMISPASRRAVRGPDRRILCYVRELRRPARRIVHHVPAVYRLQTEKVLVSPARREKILRARPPKTHPRQVEAARTTWRRLGCARAASNGDAAPVSAGGAKPVGPGPAAAGGRPPAVSPAPPPPNAAPIAPRQPPPFGRLSQ